MDSETEIEQQACKFEHILSPEATDKICTFLNHPRTCPHGAAIPPGPCCGRRAEPQADRDRVNRTALVFDFLVWGRGFAPSKRGVASLPHDRNATRYFFPKNFPNPSRTCTVFTPGFGTVSPAFEMCMYRTSTDHACFPKKYIPNAAPEVKFIVEVPAGTSCVVNSVPPLNSR